MKRRHPEDNGSHRPLTQQQVAVRVVSTPNFPSQNSVARALLAAAKKRV